MPRETKANDVELNKRVEEISILLSRFMSRRQILQYVAEKTNWNINNRMVDYYIQKAKEKLKETQDTEELKGKIRKNFEQLYNKNLNIDDYRECRAVLESMLRLFGANSPNKLDITTNGENISSNVVVEIIDKREDVENTDN